MADEFYREEIIFDVNDEDAARRVRNIENRVNKTINRMRRQTKTLSRMRARPIIDVRDRMTKQIQRADKLILKLSNRKASPVITATDKVSDVVKDVDKMLGKLTKRNTRITAKMKGDLLEKVQAAEEAISQIKGARLSPTGRLRGNLTRELNDVRRMLNDIGTRNFTPRITLKDRASVVLNRIQSGLRKVASKSWEMVIAAKDRTFAVFRGIRRRLTSLQGMATIVISFIGLNKLNQLTTGAAMNFEQYEVSMTHWLDGNTKKAQELIKWMGQFADITPFNSDDLFPALTRAVGISETTNQAKDLLRVAADMAALTPGKTVQDAMEALADAQMGEFERMKEFQIKMTQEQYKAIGGWAGFIDLVQKRVEGGAEKLSDTAIGLISTISGYTKSQFRSLGEGILESLKPRLETVVSWLEDNQETINGWKDTLAEWGKQGADALFKAFERTVVKIDELFSNPEFQNADFFGKVKIAWDELISQPFSDWYNSTGKMKIQETANTIGSNIGEFIGAGLMALFGAGGNGGGDFANAGATAATSFLNGFAENFDLGKIISKGVQSLYNINKNAFQSPGNFIGALIADAIVIGLATRLAKALGGGLLMKGFGNMLAGKTIFGREKTPKPPKPPKLPKGGTGGDTTVMSRRQRRQAQRTRRRTPKTTDPVYTHPWGRQKGQRPTVNVPNVSKLRGGKNFLKRIPILGTLLSGFEFLTARGGKNKSGAAGGGLGAIAGGAVGSLFGPLGMLGGSFIGEFLGRKAGEGIHGLFGKSKESATATQATEPGFNMQELVAQGQIAAKNMKDLSGWLAKASTWVVGSFHPLSDGRLSHNANALTSWLGDASTWIVTAFFPLSQSNLGHNVNALTTWAGQASTWVVSAFYPLVGNGATLNHNTRALTTWLGQASTWVVTAFYPLQQGGSRLNHNVNALTSWLAQASTWVASLYGIQSKAEGVKNALDRLANRIRNIRVSNVTVGGSVPARAYAKGGIVRKPHVGLVGEDGPESIIPLSPKRRNRALELYRRTGQALGVRPYAEGGLVGVGANYRAPEVQTQSNGQTVNLGGGINLNFDLSGLVGQIVVQNQEELDGKADEIAMVIAAKLKAIFDNLT